MKNIVHLHWLWKQGPNGCKGVSVGGTLCSLQNIPRSKFTAHKEDATCKECLRRAKE